MERKKLVDEIFKSVINERNDLKKDAFKHFLKIFLMKSPIEDLASISVQDWANIAQVQYGLIEGLESKPFNFKLIDGTCDSGTYVNFHLVVEDTPFLVDSLKLLMNDCHYQILGVVNSASIYFDKNESNEIINVSYDRNDDKPYALLFFQMLKSYEHIPFGDLSEEIESLLEDIRHAVMDWETMRSHLVKTAESYQMLARTNYSNVDEIIDFAMWIKEFFTFLGLREYKKVGRNLELIEGSQLGVLKLKNASSYKPIDRAIPQDELLLISKTSTMSRIHRNVQTDLIIFKTVDHKGRCVGEKRFVGLFTSDAFDSDPLRIPLLRQKIKEVVSLSDLNSSRFARKKLLYILRSLPREELFQAKIDELYHLSLGIYELQDRHLFRAFLRYDANRRFVSCHVYLPRINFTTNVYHRIKALLCQKLRGVLISGTPTFKGSNLMAIHFIIARDEVPLEDVDAKEISSLIQTLAESWSDLYMKALIQKHGYERGISLFNQLYDSFEPSYQANYAPQVAVQDSALIGMLGHDNPIHFQIYKSPLASESGFHLKILQYNIQKMTLSRLLPMLENMEFYVINERSFKLMVAEDVDILINDVIVVPRFTSNVDLDLLEKNLLPCLQALYDESIENDPLNALVSKTDLSHIDAQIIRVYCKYLHQLNFGLSDLYVQLCLLKQPKIVSDIIKLFHFRFDPQLNYTHAEAATLAREILESIDMVENSDEDRVLRQLLGMISATVRTNFYHQTDGAICIKLMSNKVPSMPVPRPEFDAFVYAVTFEGIHLRSGKVARGGLRWSNRRDDFRTEVLDLMSAQRVKNAIIVPAGAKGGFVLKSSTLDYEQLQKLGIVAYKQFIGALLSICDNVIDSEIIKPKGLRCYDGDDPYFVVAADKGTATFSDTANIVARGYDFWLDDAFASGGRFGYDHKVLGITAKGAWESVKWLFKTLSIDMNQPFRVVGIGDMSGDVFGNGMLLSENIKLVAAFNHESIFLDPNPNAKKSFLERKRLFNLPRSHWSDYNKRYISKGGGVFSRTSKLIPLSDQAREMLGLEVRTISPNDLIKAILLAEVELLWNGGIGTYIKSSDQSNHSVGDKFNDAVRVDAANVRAKVIAEGGNLGLTQLARVEFASHGGLVNADFIDNSGGVDCSDVEVNTKILLNDAIQKKTITFEDRNSIMQAIQDDVIVDILNRNAQQNHALSIAQYHLSSNMVLYLSYLHWLENHKIIDRQLSGISNDARLLTRTYFTRPELAIIFSNTILWLKGMLEKSSIIKGEIVEDFLFKGFPSPLVKRFKNQIECHYLRDQIIATQLSNHFIREVGVTFIHQLSSESSRSFEEIIQAYLIARQLIKYEKQKQFLMDVKHQITAEQVTKTLEYIRRLLRRIVRFLLTKHYSLDMDSESLDNLVKKVKGVFEYCCKYECNQTVFNSVYDEFIEQGVDPVDAKKISQVTYYWHSINIIEGIDKTQSSNADFVKLFFNLRSKLKIDLMLNRLDQCVLNDFIDNVSKISLKFDIENTFLRVVVSVMNSTMNAESWYEKMQNQNWEELSEKIIANQPSNLNPFVVVNRSLSDMMAPGID